ncbi:zinc transporter ZIP1 [Latimeria chalumnae]|uniref:Solute carrier family 39 member 1 n=1 Tax=Latimeria chalumnae TaxID=7897 RepID=H3AAT6_LATCH|nr:PREDICTED: zinc transporter ZIP1 [Latimeria chalumnae]|eukprot:XP_006008653.1 PREDICTED: zinc transporter ZIP1 [Latimeria chalumnae]
MKWKQAVLLSDAERMVRMPSLGPALVTGLEVKLSALVVLLAMTMLCGFIPLCLVRHSGRTSASVEKRQQILSLVSCFAGGVFLATCLLDLVPDYLSGMNDLLAKQQIELDFPLPEFIMAMGFFVVLVMEQIVLAFKDQSRSLEETRALLGSSVDNVNIQSQQWSNSSQHQRKQREGEGSGGVHIHVDFNSHSPIRSFILVFSLSLHSIFEGLAVGLQEANSKVLEICIALLIHKSIIAFSLTLKLIQSRLRQRVVVACIMLFAVMSPLGIGLGIALSESEDAVHQMVRCVLEGIATGTFIYITFLEILPHELNSPEQRIQKVVLLIIGFSVVTGVLFIKF